MNAPALKTIAYCSCCHVPHGRVGQKHCAGCHRIYQRNWARRQTEKLRKYRDIEKILSREAPEVQR